MVQIIKGEVRYFFRIFRRNGRYPGIGLPEDGAPAWKTRMEVRKVRKGEVLMPLKEDGYLVTRAPK